MVTPRDPPAWRPAIALVPADRQRHAAGHWGCGMLGQFDHQVRSNAWNQWCRYYQLPSGEPAWPEGTVHRDYPGAVIARQDIVTNIGGFVQEPFSAIDFGRAVRDALDAPLAGNDA